MVEVWAGYFDAPGTRDARLGTGLVLGKAVPELPNVTIVFCCIEGLRKLKARTHISSL